MSGHAFEPLISLPAWFALSAAAAAILAWYALRRPAGVPRGRWWRIVALMACGLALPLVVLLNPTWLRPEPPPPGKPLLTLLVDESASMAAADAAGGKPRYVEASTLAATLDRRMKDRFEVRVRTFATAPSAGAPSQLTRRTPEGKSTDLIAALAASLAEDRANGQAVVLLSDGIHNAGGGSADVLDTVRLAQAMSTPIFTRTVGGEPTQWDLAVSVRSPQALAHIGQNVPITVRVTPRGLNQGLAQLVLRRDGQELARQPAELSLRGPTDVVFYVTEQQAGVYRYEAAADPLEGEVSAANNTAACVLHVVDEPIRVLLLEGKPYWDAKFLARTLISDPAVALDSVVRLAETRLLRRTLSRSQAANTTPAADGAAAAPGVQAAPPAAPAGAEPAAPRIEQWEIVNNAAAVLADVETLTPYQVVVLGRDAEVFLTDGAIANLRTWIAREGGSLVCFRGAPAARINERLGSLLPVKWTPGAESRFHVKLTDEGRQLQWLPDADGAADPLVALPALTTNAPAGQAKPLSVVLATAEGAGGQQSPVLAYQPYGAGRVVMVEGAGMWRWAFLPPQHQSQDEVYRGLWQSLLRWLVSNAGLLANQSLTLRTDKVSFDTTESATATLLVRQRGGLVEPPRVELRAKGSAEPRAFSPAPIAGADGVFRVTFGKLPEGDYEAVIAGAAAAVAAVEDGATVDDDTAGRALFDVRSLGAEQLDLKARPDLMARIAKDSGGAVLTNNAEQEVLRGFEQHMARTRPPRIERITAWDRWWVLLGGVGLWALAWGVRRSGGLV